MYAECGLCECVCVCMGAEDYDKPSNEQQSVFVILCLLSVWMNTLHVLSVETVFLSMIMKPTIELKSY